MAAWMVHRRARCMAVIIVWIVRPRRRLPRSMQESEREAAEVGNGMAGAALVRVEGLAGGLGGGGHLARVPDNDRVRGTVARRIPDHRLCVGVERHLFVFVTEEINRRNLVENERVRPLHLLGRREWLPIIGDDCS